MKKRKKNEFFIDQAIVRTGTDQVLTRTSYKKAVLRGECLKIKHVFMA